MGLEALGLRSTEQPGPRTVICYGQTGTGKTHTFSGVLDVIGECLSRNQCSTAAHVYIQFYEIHGKKCYDLMNERKVVKILSDEEERVHARGAKTVAFALRGSSETEADCLARFRKALAAALKMRSTRATQRNDLSSRSHSIFTISLVDEEKERRERISREASEVAKIEVS